MRRVIVDVDVGTDDFVALLTFLYAEKIGQLKIDAIICSTGNTSVQNVVSNVVRLLEIVGRTDIPVFRGAEKQLILPKDPISKFHGEDGFADLQHDHQPDTSIVSEIPAAVALHDIIINNPNEISLICLAPLTNLALSIKLFHDLLNKVKDVWIMGGNHSAIGNATSAAEYNFYVDPEAAYIVLECLVCPIFILPWEPCLLPNISMDWRYDVLGDESPALKLLTRAEKVVYSKSSEEHWLPCDAFLSFCYLDPRQHITKKSAHHATVELNSCYTRGQVVLDHLKNKKPNVTIIERFDEELFQKLMLKVKESLLEV